MIILHSSGAGSLFALHAVVGASASPSWLRCPWPPTSDKWMAWSSGAWDARLVASQLDCSAIDALAS
jgi:hypothetical protein